MTDIPEDKLAALRAVPDTKKMQSDILQQTVNITNRGTTMPDFSDAGTEPFIIGSTVYHMEFNGTMHEFEVLPSMLTPEQRGKGHNVALMHLESKDRDTYNYQMFSTCKSDAIRNAMNDMEEMRQNIRAQLGGIETALTGMQQELRKVLKQEGKPSLVQTDTTTTGKTE